MALVNAGAPVSAEDKDGLTGEDWEERWRTGGRRTGAATGAARQFGRMSCSFAHVQVLCPLMTLCPVLLVSLLEFHDVQTSEISLANQRALNHVCRMCLPQIAPSRFFSPV